MMTISAILNINESYYSTGKSDLIVKYRHVFYLIYVKFKRKMVMGCLMIKLIFGII